MIQEIISRIGNCFKNRKSDRKKFTYPTVVVEEGFTASWPEEDVTYKIRFEIPIPILDVHTNKEEIEMIRMNADETFRPIAIVLKNYLSGLCGERSTERFVIGRDNLIMAIKHCAIVQKRMIEESEKNL